MKKIILNGIIMGLSFFFTVFCSMFVYSAWTNLQTQNTGDKITSTIWNDLINKVNTIGTTVDSLGNIPSGGIMAFNLSTCPTGWSEADGTNGNPDLRGEFIRGLDNGRGVDSGRVLASSQSDMLKSHNHPFTEGASWRISGGSGSPYGGLGGSNWSGTSNPTGVVGYNGGTETRPRNLAFLYCIKN